MLLSPAEEGDPVLHVLEEVRLLYGEVFVHDLEELPVQEDVRCPDLYGHGPQLLKRCLTGVVVVGSAVDDELPDGVPDPGEHPLDHPRPVEAVGLLLLPEEEGGHQMTEEHLSCVCTELPSLKWLLCACHVLPVQIHNFCKGF